MATITTINASDQITNSRSDINSNFSNLNTDKIETSVLDTDTSLAANSDAKIATQKAVKAYVDSGGNTLASTINKGIVEEATIAEVVAKTAEGGTGARLFVNPSTLPSTDVQTFTSTDTWEKPAAGIIAFIQAWGAGGSGGSGGSGLGGGGGGGGSYVERWIPVASLGATETVTIGDGGPAQGADGTAGTAGGNTTFGVHVTAYGGGAGGLNAGGGGGGVYGAGASATTTTGGAGGSPQTATLGAGGADAVPGNPGVLNFDGGGGGGSGPNDSGADRNGGGGGLSVRGGGGGGGGGQDLGAVGGASMYGGGGGGGGSGTSTPGTGGVSKFGGSGGAGAVDSANATAGSAPGGGGGGSETGLSGAGGAGKVIVTVF